MNPQEQAKEIRQDAEAVTIRMEQLFSMSFIKIISRIWEHSRTPVDLDNRLVEATMRLLNTHRGVAVAGFMMQNATLAEQPDPVNSKSLERYLDFLDQECRDGRAPHKTKETDDVVKAIRAWMKLPPSMREEAYNLKKVAEGYEQ